MAALDAGAPARRAERRKSRRPRTTEIYDWRRQNQDPHAADAVVAYATSG
jgi:hypothetical protein